MSPMRSVRQSDSCAAIDMMMAAGVLVLAAMYPAQAHAQYLGSILCNVYTNTGAFPILISGIGYIGGGAFLLAGGKALVKFTENAAQNPLSKAIWKIMAAAGLIAMPSFIGWLIATLAITGAGGTQDLGVCTGGTAPVAGNPGVPLDQMVTNIINNIRAPVAMLLGAMCYILGGVLIVQGLVRANKFGSDGKSSLSAIISSLLTGCMLIAAAQVMMMFENTLFGDNEIKHFSGLAWSTLPGGVDVTRINKTFEAIMTFVQMIGWVAFMRGVYVLKARLEGGQATMGVAMSHIIGGALAINIVPFVNSLAETAGMTAPFTSPGHYDP